MNAKELAEKCGAGSCGCLHLRVNEDKKLYVNIFDIDGLGAWFSEASCICCTSYGGCHVVKLYEIPLTDDLLIPILLKFGGKNKDDMFVKWQGKQIAKFVLEYLKNR